ncbi:MAG TPA: SPOR domain-containing protein [Bacteroidales bacterium]|mgnify:CR=1 FL=1|nr:SPOR domain-containing protein [Bacteroidales bacterium]HRW96198.1 SPOR domain-containing protein [Bacteroidales bacterium]
MIRFLTLLFFLIIIHPGQLASQNDHYRSRTAPQDLVSKGHIVIHRDDRVDKILKRHIEYNQESEGIEGYRIHIFFESGNQSLSKANEAARKYQLLYPEEKAYVSFSEPYYRVRVGDFRTRFDAEKYLQKISGDYPNAFIIKDRINFPRLD